MGTADIATMPERILSLVPTQSNDAMGQTDNAAPLRYNERQSLWLSPQFLVQTALSLVIIFGGLVGTYVISTSKSAVMDATVQRMETHVSQIANSAEQMSNTVTRIQAEREADRRQIEELQQLVREHQAYIVKMTNDIARMQAKMDK